MREGHFANIAGQGAAADAATDECFGCFTARGSAADYFATQWSDFRCGPLTQAGLTLERTAEGDFTVWTRSGIEDSASGLAVGLLLHALL